MKALTRFENWMLQESIRHAKTESIPAVAARLRSQDYNRVADALINPVVTTPINYTEHVIAKDHHWLKGGRR